MTYRLGDINQLSQKYGDITPNNDYTITKSITNKYIPINKKATFQERKSLIPFKITLPTEPSLLKKSTIVPTTVFYPEVETTFIIDKKSHIRELLNFIDLDKLTEKRPGIYRGSYLLEELKFLMKELELTTTNKSKSNIISIIKNTISKELTGNNLISDIKLVKPKNLTKIKILKNLFDNHNISQSTQKKLLSIIEKKINDYRTTTDLTPIIIKVIEQQWLPTKK